jgi:hypothetical protein
MMNSCWFYSDNYFSPSVLPQLFPTQELLPMLHLLQSHQQQRHKQLLVLLRSESIGSPTHLCQVIASAGIRLYKFTSGGYEAQAGGTPLGCVLVGSGIQYQLLIYNAQVG